MDESPKQLIEVHRESVAMKPGRESRVDYEYIRNGVVNIFMANEPLRGKRLVEVTESKTKLDKTYLTKWVESDKDGFFGSFKSLCKKIASIIHEINPAYKFPNALVSTSLLAAEQQYFFLSHLPSLTNIKQNKHKHEKIYEFLETMVFNSIKR